LFREVVQKIDGRLGPNYDMDLSWCEVVERKAEQKKERLENELNAYRVILDFYYFGFLLFSKFLFIF
jgi:COP9 signalosome complex subunit 1